MPSTGGNTCVVNFAHTTIFPNGPKDFEDKDDGRVIGNLVGLNLFDDYGHGVTTAVALRLAPIVTAKGCSSVFCLLKRCGNSLDLMEAGDVNFIKDFYYRLAHCVGELSHLAHGSYAIAERWNFGEEYWATRKINSGRRLAIRFTMPMKRQRRSVPLLTDVQP
ncbi:hypothetical protein ACLK17_10195 [Escherichia coli]